MEIIKELSIKVDEIHSLVDNFTEAFLSLSKRRSVLSEILFNLMIDLDAVETNGNENIRLSRKKQIVTIQRQLQRIDKCMFNI